MDVKMAGGKMLKTYEAHLVKVKGTLMEIKIHGGSTVTVPKVEGIDDTTLLVVTMEPASNSIANLMTMEQFKKATTAEPMGKEYIEEIYDNDIEFDIGNTLDGSLPDR